MPGGQGFLDVLRGDSDALVNAEEAMTRVVEAANRTGKPGSVTLTVKVHRPKNSEEGRVYVTAAVVERIPRAETRDRQFFVTDDGSLSRRDPRQPEMPGLTTVERDAPVERDKPAESADNKHEGAERTEAKPRGGRTAKAK